MRCTMRLKTSLTPALLLALALAACGREPEAANQSNMTAEQADNALDEALNAVEDGEAADNADLEGLTPPAPGEPAGLPDDRTPLNESAARNPTNVEASGATIEQWAFAIGERRYGDAAKLWRPESGKGTTQVAGEWNKYAALRVPVGRPVARDTQSVTVPVQIYGRERDGGKPFNLLGSMTLVRNTGQGQPAWLIAGSQFKPLGTVKVAGAADSAMAIPVAFRGDWSASKASCGKPGDDMRLAVSTDSLVFYESVGKVTALTHVAADRVRLTAQYEGEGDKWSETSTLALSNGGEALTVGNVKRVRCA